MRRLTAGASNNIRPSWSRDGRWIYFGSNRSGEWQIWKTLTYGGTAVQVTKKGGSEAFESSDGKDLYYVKQFSAGIWKAPVQGGEETQVLDQGMESLWALTQQGIYFGEINSLHCASAQVLSFRNTPNGDLQRIFERHTAGSRFDRVFRFSRRPMDSLHAV